MFERGLLLGLLGMQNGFLSKQQVLSAFSTSLNNGVPLDEVLRNESTLSPADFELLDPLVERYLRQYGGKAQDALEQLSSVDDIRSEMSALADAKPELKSRVSWFSQASQKTIAFPTTATPHVASSSSESHRFHIIRKHAEGGLGIVYVADDRQLRREVALKQIRTDRADEEIYRLKFSQEAEITGQLEHPGIVPIYALGADDDGRPYYAMRFIRGESLRDEVKKFHESRRDGSLRYDGPELRQLLRRFIDVCDAIEYAHDRGVLHRDLKPGNVMLGKYGETLVVDWGLAKPLGHMANSKISEQSELPVEPSGGESGSDTRHGQFLGTIAYAPPEQLLGKLDELSAASDVYSLGAVLYELLTGVPPITGAKSVSEAVAAIEALQNHSPRESRAEIPIALAEICRKAMRKDRAERYQSARALRDDLQLWLDDRPTTAFREPFSTTAFRWMRQHQALASSIAILFVAGIVGSSGYWTLRSQSLAREAILQASADSAKWDSVSEKAIRAANQGDMQTAIALLEKLRTDRGSLSTDQQLSLARLYFFSQDTAQASNLLRSFDATEVDETQLARYNLLLGDVLYGGTTQENEGEQLIRQAMTSEKLPEAESAYARGLLAETPYECIADLQECLRLDAFHAMARVRLGMCFVLVGKPVSAIELSQLGKQLHQQDWRFNYIIAFAHATSGKRELMETELSVVPETPDTASLKKVCRVSATAVEFIVKSADQRKPVSQFALLLKVTPLITEVADAMASYLASNEASDDFSSITPRLGWFGSFYDAIGDPELDTVGLTKWLTGVILQGKAATNLSNLEPMFPDHKLIQVLAAGQHIIEGDYKAALEACAQARNAEDSFQELDYSLMVCAVLALGNLEPEVEQGLRTRDFQRNEIAKWSDFFTSVPQAITIDPSYDLQLQVVWRLLLKNGFSSEAKLFAEQQSSRNDLDQQQHNAWSNRVDFSAELIDELAIQAKEIKADPRFNL